MAIEIVELPTKNGDFPWFFVCLPEGIVSRKCGFSGYQIMENEPEILG